MGKIPAVPLPPEFQISRVFPGKSQVFDALPPEPTVPDGQIINLHLGEAFHRILGSFHNGFSVDVEAGV
jgi:hypothetical protein